MVWTWVLRLLYRVDLWIVERRLLWGAQWLFFGYGSNTPVDHDSWYLFLRDGIEATSKHNFTLVRQYFLVLHHLQVNILRAFYATKLQLTASLLTQDRWTLPVSVPYLLWCREIVNCVTIGNRLGRFERWIPVTDSIDRCVSCWRNFGITGHVFDEAKCAMQIVRRLAYAFGTS